MVCGRHVSIEMHEELLWCMQILKSETLPNKLIIADILV
jgi:hypothetical protein